MRRILFMVLWKFVNSMAWNIACHGRPGKCHTLERYWFTEIWRWRRTHGRHHSQGLIPGLLSRKGSASVQPLSHVRLFATPWTAAFQASLSTTNSRSLLTLMSIESVVPSNHLIIYHPLLLPPSVFLSIRVFSSESVLCIRWPKYWSFSFSIGSWVLGRSERGLEALTPRVPWESPWGDTAIREGTNQGASRTAGFTPVSVARGQVPTASTPAPNSQASWALGHSIWLLPPGWGPNCIRWAPAAAGGLPASLSASTS